MQTGEHSGAVQQNPFIAISGNARVIVGDVHGVGDDFFHQQLRAAQWTTRFRTRYIASTVYRDAPSESALTVLRLSVLLVKDFDDVKLLMGRFRRSGNIAERYAMEIEVRQTILRLSIQNVLSAHGAAQCAPSMMKNDQHSMWSVPRLVDLLNCSLASTVRTLRYLLDLISQDIAAIGSIVKTCMTLPKEDDVNIGPGVAYFRDEHKINHKANLVVHNGQLAKHLKALQGNVQDLQGLLRQQSSTSQTPQLASYSSTTKDNVGKLRTVNEAATELYHAFRLACDQHEKHPVSLRIHADYGSPHQIQFMLLLSRSGGASVDSMHWKGAEFRLKIESQLIGKKDSLHQQFSDKSIAPQEIRTKRKLDTLCNIKFSKTYKHTTQEHSEYFSQCSETDPITDTSRRTTNNKSNYPKKFDLGLPAHSNPPLLSEFPNFCLNRDFCTHIVGIVPPSSADILPLGYFYREGSSKHIIYLSQRAGFSESKNIPSRVCSPIHALTTMKNILKSSKQGTVMLRHDVVRIAKELSFAILQYYTTPWLNGPLDSDRILLELPENIGDMTQNPDDYHLTIGESRIPYIDVSIEDLAAKPSPEPITTSRSVIRNSVLFSLGVMLIELAFAQPLEEMQKPQDVDPYNQHNTEYYIAERLQKSVSAMMGPVFSEVVRKCIKCDFGHGEDLTTDRLQESFYDHVVEKLDILEAKLKDLGI